MSGKGDKPRPFSISQEEYARRWDAAFSGTAMIGREKIDNIEEIIQDIKEELDNNVQYTE